MEVSIASTLFSLVKRALVPFYTPPSGYEKRLLGTILKTRQVDVAQYGLLPENVEAAYQTLYRTSQWDSSASATVATVLIPYNAKAEPTQLVGYQIAEDAVTTICAPSYLLQQGYTEVNYVAELEILFINLLLAKGITVVTPDYEGPRSEYTVGLTAAHMTLDVIRATLSFTPAVPKKNSVRYAMWGCSGDALASAWAAQEQPTYAPELEFSGVALGGLPVNVTAILLNINGGNSSGIAFSGVAGQMLAYPTFQKYVTAHLNDTSIRPKVESQCLVNNLVEFIDKSIFSYINVQFVYNTNREVDHTVEAIIGSSGALDFLYDRLNGIPVLIQGCAMEEVDLISLDEGTVLTTGSEVFNELTSLLYLPLGSLGTFKK